MINLELMRKTPTPKAHYTRCVRGVSLNAISFLSPNRLCFGSFCRPRVGASHPSGGY